MTATTSTIKPTPGLDNHHLTTTITISTGNTTLLNHQELTFIECQKGPKHLTCVNAFITLYIYLYAET